MSVVAIIPSRYASSRFPGKPLAIIGGKSMVQRVYEQALLVKGLDRAIVATDDQRIYDHVAGFGGDVQMTRHDHATGTDRCAEVAAGLTETEIIINIQGDEPFLVPQQIEQLIDVLKQSSGKGIATLAKKINSVETLFNPNVVKLVMNLQQQALYFSRSVIPHLRGVEKEGYMTKGTFYKHLGLYGFYKNTLLELTNLKTSVLEQSESLEQLRWLEAGYRIQIGITPFETRGIDSPKDLEAAENWLRNNS